MSAKIALVTGASRGIGKAIATQLAEDGFRVAGTATSQAGANLISDYLGDKGRGFVLNVTDPNSIKQTIANVSEDLGAISVLVNNAGVTKDTLLMRMKETDWESIIDTNLSSVFRMSQACLRAMMKAKYGRIVNITSVVGVTGNPGQANYSASKAGMIGFTKSLAREVGARNITVNAVAPGFIDTDMTSELPEQQKQALLSNIPVARLGQAEEVAFAVSFLCSNKAAYTTGETIHVNGGMYMA